MLEPLATEPSTEPAGDPEPPPLTWRERLWIVPSETRIGVFEVCEALGKPRSWLYKHTSVKAAASNGYEMIPHRKLNGELMFVAGELRAWVRDSEEVVRAWRMEASPTDGMLRLTPKGRDAA